MSLAASQFHSSLISARLFSQTSRVTLAAALLGLFVTFRPAVAQVEGDASIFNVPGEGPPYVSRLHPRYWPPMPEKNPYYFEGPSRYDAAPFAEYDRPPYRKKVRAHVKKRKKYVEKYDDHEPEDRVDIVEDHIDDDEKYPRRDHVYADRRHNRPATTNPHRFGRLFKSAEIEHGPHRPSFKALQELGKSMVEDVKAGDHAGDSEMPAGYTFLGQFIDHDLTLDTTTDLGLEIKGDFELLNARTPDLDLDSVYGGGPKRTPHLYRLPYIRVGRLISDSERTPRYDLFRTKASYYYGPSGGEAVALLGDPRNDENIVVSQLHAAFIAFHNRTVDILVEADYAHQRERYCDGGRDCGTHELAEALPPDVKRKIFETAQDHVIHFYHRLIVEDFLPRVIGPEHTANLLKKGRDFYYPDGFRNRKGHIDDVSIPVEFAAAAFRYGHSQVRENYALRNGVKIDLLSDGHDDGPRAFEPVRPRYLVDWRYFFEVDHKVPYGFNHARLIDGDLVKSLHNLGFSNVVGMDEVVSLASRNLSRSKVLHLPSGQDVARIVLPALEARGLLGKGDDDYGPGYDGPLWKAYLLPPDERTADYLDDADTPLWYYILQEASVFGTKTHLRALPHKDKKELHLSEDYGPEDYGPEHDGRLIRPASIHYLKHGSVARKRDYDDGYYDRPGGGHRLGPVGATIVGEVLIGLVDHYRTKTGKGLDYRPEIEASNSVLSHGYGKKKSAQRYLMRNFLIDAGVLDEAGHAGEYE